MIHRVMNIRKYPSICTGYQLPGPLCSTKHQISTVIVEFTDSELELLTPATETEDQLVSFLIQTPTAPIIQYAELHHRKDTPVLIHTKKKASDLRELCKRLSEYAMRTPPPSPTGLTIPSPLFTPLLPHHVISNSFLPFVA
jgi:hypothetical protein